ncbi:MAG: hypothetical protein AB7N24_23645 [Dehalococcoidia bacterium]
MRSLVLLLVLFLAHSVPVAAQSEPHLLIVIGDSWAAGWGSHTGTVPAGTPKELPGVKVWNRWYSDLRFSNLAHTDSWETLRRDCALKSDLTMNGPAPVFEFANRYRQLTGVTTLYVIQFGFPGSDVVPNMLPQPGIRCPQPGGSTWDPAQSSTPWILFRDHYLQPALASLPNNTVRFAGVAFSLGNNAGFQAGYCGQVALFDGAMDRLLSNIGLQLGVTTVPATGYVPHLDPTAQPYANNMPTLAAMQAEKLAWPSAYNFGAVLDCRPFPTGYFPLATNDPYHLNALGYLRLGEELATTHVGLVSGLVLPLIP